DGISAIAELAVEINSTQEDIGARRLQSILEHIVEEISFDVEEEGAMKSVVVDRKFVEDNFSKSMSLNLKKYIL
ncbi:MAG: HslU--HslV peptidase ATPase subunit, partial [Clostridia bacterium]